MITYDQNQLRDLSVSSAKEWLLTDGDGGFASSTISFMNTRRQHSLLTVSANTPLKRLTLLNKVDEEVIIDNKSYFLGTNHYPGTIFPDGYKHLSRFVFDYFPEVTFDLDGCQLTKKVLMPKRSSSVFIHYENNSKKAITLRLLPLVSFRWKDALKKADDGFLVDELPDGIRIIADMSLPKLYLKLSQIYNTSPESYWYYGFIYAHDADKYADDREDLYNMGYWETELEPGKGLTFAGSTRDLAEFDYDEIESHHIEAIDKVRMASALPANHLHLADIASNHVVRNKAIRSSAIISGYPYGSMAIRETLLSLDGISYVSENPHYENALLYDVASNEVNGVFPSAIDEATLNVSYDDPQMPLFFAIAVARCADKEKKQDCVRRYLPLLENAIEIIGENSLGGTKIKESGLIDVCADMEESLAKTAKNAVVNALWYNLLKLVEQSRTTNGSFSSDSEPTAEIETSYFDSFFGPDGNHRNINARDGVTLDMVMPLVVPFSPLTEEQRSKVCKALVRRFLHNYADERTHEAPNHDCNLAAIYLTESSSQLEGCKEEYEKMKEFVGGLLRLERFSNCVSGLPKCGNDRAERRPQDISSSVVVGESIRLIKKLKLE
ncbi:MAG: glycogen debranching enzyme N-terminal domain-containing protein [Bacteroidetes bacterium]|nr:glycogen debranching enzyme N-terminal domain-containing protein [Bacteroidota bacterium]